MVNTKNTKNTKKTTKTPKKASRPAYVYMLRDDLSDIFEYLFRSTYDIHKSPARMKTKFYIDQRTEVNRTDTAMAIGHLHIPFILHRFKGIVEMGDGQRLLKVRVNYWFPKKKKAK